MFLWTYKQALFLGAACSLCCALYASRLEAHSMSARLLLCCSSSPLALSATPFENKI